MAVSADHQGFAAARGRVRRHGQQKKAEADLAYDLQRFKTGQLVKKEEVSVSVVEVVSFMGRTLIKVRARWWR